MRAGARGRFHVGMRAVSVGAVVTETRLMRGALVGAMVVRRREAVGVAAVEDGGAGTRSVRAVGDGVAAEQAHVAQRAEYGAAARGPVGVAVRREGRGAGGCERQTRGLGVVVQGSGMLRLGGVVVAVQVVVGREARRVFDAARHAGRGGGPTAGAVVRAVLVVAVEARRRVAAVVAGVGRARIATLGGVAVLGRASEDCRGDAVVVLAVAVLVRAAGRRALAGRSGRRRIGVACRGVTGAAAAVEPWAW